MRLKALPVYLILSGTLFGQVAQAEECPAEGARYVIKGFTMETKVTASGEALHPKWGCKWMTEDGRELWWDMGEDVVAVTAGRPASPGGRPKGTKMGGARSAAGGGDHLAAGSVYTCTLPGVGMFTGAYFGIVDDSTYRDFDGRRGQYEFDVGTGILRLTTGSSAGLAYKRQSPGYFRVLDDNDAITGGSCVLNTEKSIDGRW
ncbi:MAG: hypothetical protein IPK97_04005 [Ahniella sp.]|nr:hypothetical protein [Ahniella sp.]